MLMARSVAIVGASEDSRKVGFRPVRFLLDHGYKGTIRPVNPRLRTCQGLPCFPSLTAVPEVPDLACIVVPAERVPDSLEEVGRVGIPAAIVMSSGFAEHNQAGHDIQQRLRDIAARYSILLCGPNSVGLIHAPNHLVASFSEALTRGELLSGCVGMVSQSGAFGTIIYASARARGLGVRTFVSTGNEATTEAADYVEALLEDPQIRVVGSYMEQVRDGVRFMRVAARARELGKPLVLMKVGRSDAGRIAAASHTAALAGDDRAYEAAFKRFGVARAIDEQHLLDVLEAFECSPQLPAGHRVAVATMSGGAGVLLSDLIGDAGLELARLAAPTRARLRAALPSFATLDNPVDLTGQSVANSLALKEAFAALADDPGVDLLVVFMGLGWTGRENWVEAMQNAVARGMPVLAIAPLDETNERRQLLNAGVPSYRSPAQAIRVAKTLTTWAEWRPRTETAPLESPARLWTPHELGEDQAKRALHEAGLSTPEAAVAVDADDAFRIATSIGSRVVLKLDADHLPHKTDIGGVQLNIPLTGVRSAYARILARVRLARPDLTVSRVRVEQMVANGVDCVIGALEAAPFGTMVMVGLGGVHVELLGDVVFALAPVSEDEAADMIAKLRAYPILAGFRGGQPADVAALARATSIISRLAAGLNGRLVELDVNPIRVLSKGQGAIVLDAYARLQPGALAGSRVGGSR